MSKQIIEGSNLMLFSNVEGGSGSTMTALAAATSCKVGLKGNVQSKKSKDSGCWDESDVTTLSWDGSSDNLFTIEDYSTLMNAMIARKPIMIQFSTVKNADSVNGMPTGGWTPNTDGFKGLALITSLEATGNNGDNATYSVSLTGTGPLTPMV